MPLSPGAKFSWKIPAWLSCPQGDWKGIVICFDSAMLGLSWAGQEVEDGEEGDVNSEQKSSITKRAQLSTKSVVGQGLAN